MRHNQRTDIPTATLSKVNHSGTTAPDDPPAPTLLIFPPPFPSLRDQPPHSGPGSADLI